MKCSLCGGLVTWRGPLSNLTHTECARCGRQNCQEVEPIADDEDEPDWEHPCPFRGEPTMTPAGEACSACGLRERDINDAADGVAAADNWQRPDNTCPRCKQPAFNLFRTRLPGDELDTTHCGCLYRADGGPVCPECGPVTKCHGASEAKPCPVGELGALSREVDAMPGAIRPPEPWPRNAGLLAPDDAQPKGGA